MKDCGDVMQGSLSPDLLERKSVHGISYVTGYYLSCVHQMSCKYSYICIREKCHCNLNVCT